MLQAKFSEGDRVTFSSSRYSNTSKDEFVITRRLPVTNEGFHYRVKSAHDSHERVAIESELVQSGSRPGL